jgi:hypothetical protein
MDNETNKLENTIYLNAVFQSTVLDPCLKKVMSFLWTGFSLKVLLLLHVRYKICMKQQSSK